jgi:hypothetical protein
MTAVSKPNRKLPNADTTVANKRFLFIGYLMCLSRELSVAGHVFDEESDSICEIQHPMKMCGGNDKH